MRLCLREGEAAISKFIADRDIYILAVKEGCSITFVDATKDTPEWYCKWPLRTPGIPDQKNAHLVAN